MASDKEKGEAIGAEDVANWSDYNRALLELMLSIGNPAPDTIHPQVRRSLERLARVASSTLKVSDKASLFKTGFCVGWVAGVEFAKRYKGPSIHPDGS